MENPDIDDEAAACAILARITPQLCVAHRDHAVLRIEPDRLHRFPCPIFLALLVKTGSPLPFHG